MTRYWIVGIVAGSLALAGCGGAKVKRTAVDEQIDLSGNWNDTDSRLVSQEMITDVLARPWIGDYTAKAGGQKPRVIVGDVANRSHEHINTQTFTKDLERELTNSGRVRFVASSEQREEVRSEKVDQAQHASAETAKAPGQEHAADYMVKGQIDTIFDAEGGKELKFYQVELELIDIATNEKAWIGQKKIKKLVARSKLKP